MEILLFCVQQKQNQMNLSPIISSHILSGVSVRISPYILDITENKGDLMVFIKSHIHSRRLKGFKIPSNKQIIPIEINLRNEKRLVASIYKASSQRNKQFLWYFINLLELYSTLHEEGIILGDFNTEVENRVLKDLGE